MERKQILLVTAGCSGPDAVESWARIAPSWPPGYAPAVRVLDLLDVTHNASEFDWDQTDALLVLHEQTAPISALHKLVDIITGPSVPALVLTAQPREVSAALGPGFATETPDATPERIAGLLTGMMARQPTIAALQADLTQANRSQFGVQGEIEKLNAELQLAATIQRELIPAAMPKVEGLELGVLFRPASFVSGDVYNAAMIDDRRLAFFLADAVGHGVPAALLTMIISQTLSLHPNCEPVHPAEAMSRLNSALCAVGGDSPRFATAVFGVLDVPTSRATICNAGHPPPIIVSGDDICEVDTGGPLLGVFDAAEFEEQHVELEHSSMLIYSDGFEVAFADESRPDGEAATGRPIPSTSYLDHLIPVARQDQSVHQTLSELSELLGSQAGSLHQPDDVTALLIRPAA